MKRLRNLLVCSFVLSANVLLAQTESTLYFMNSLPQVVDVNPAIMPRYRMSIGLPIVSSMGQTYSNNGFTYNDMVSEVDGVKQADLAKWSESLPEKNYVALAAQTDLLRFGYRVSPKVYLMTNVSVKGYNRTMLPKALATLFVDGTSQLVGSYSETSPEEEAITYLEASLGMAYAIKPDFTVGGRIKYLNGLNNVTTESSSLLIEVDNNYRIRATGKADVRTSGIYNLGREGYNMLDHIGDYMQNTGWALDLGGTYKFADKLTLGFSVIDLGFISWKNDTHQYSLDPSRATYTFSGFDMNQVLDDKSGYLAAQADSIQAKFTMDEAPRDGYTTMLPTKMYLSGNYEIVKNFSLGALFFSEQFKGRSAAGFTAAANKTFGKWLTTSLTYTVSNRSYNNIGLGMSFNFAPVQIYVVGDNLVRAPVSLIANQTLNAYLNSSQIITVRAGINLVFGWDKGLTKEVAVKDKSHNPKEKQSNSKVKNTFGRTPSKPSKKKK
jgi:hypothetical protein